MGEFLPQNETAAAVFSHLPPKRWGDLVSKQAGGRGGGATQVARPPNQPPPPPLPSQYPEPPKLGRTPSIRDPPPRKDPGVRDPQTDPVPPPPPPAKVRTPGVQPHPPPPHSEQPHPLPSAPSPLLGGIGLPPPPRKQPGGGSRYQRAAFIAPGWGANTPKRGKYTWGGG